MSGRRASDDELEQLVAQAFADERVSIDSGGNVLLDGRRIHDRRIARAFNDAILDAVVGGWLVVDE